MASTNSSSNFVSPQKREMSDGLAGRVPHLPVLRVWNEVTGAEELHYPLVYDELPEKFQRMAEKELNETQDGRMEGIRRLREHAEGSRNSPRLPDNLLLSVLRNCKYNLQKSEKKLEKFQQSRREIVWMLKELGMQKVEHIVDDMAFGLLPYRDRRGRVILYTRPYGFQLDKYEVNDVGLVLAAGGLFVLSFPITGVAGFAYFGECKSPSPYIFYAIFKAFKKYMFHMFSFPIRVSRVEILNENSMCRCFHKIVSTIVSKKIMDRVSLHGSSFEHFHELYHPDILPDDFGGNMGPLSNESYRQRLLDFIRNLMEEKC